MPTGGLAYKYRIGIEKGADEGQLQVLLLVDKVGG